MKNTTLPFIKDDWDWLTSKIDDVKIAANKGIIDIELATFIVDVGVRIIRSIPMQYSESNGKPERDGFETVDFLAKETYLNKLIDLVPESLMLTPRVINVLSVKNCQEIIKTWIDSYELMYDIEVDDLESMYCAPTYEEVSGKDEEEKDDRN